MTVSSPQNRSAFPGDGVSTQFDFSFPFQKAADITVLRRNALGVTTTLGATDYSLANTGNGGRLTLAVALPIGWRLTIVRAPAPLQETDLLENDTYSAETIEAALDYQAMVSQRLTDLLARALVLADSDVAGAGAYQANGNRISGAADAVASTDLATLGQVQAIVAAGGGSGGGTGGGGGTVIIDPSWPTIPIPDSVLDTILAGILTQAEFQAVFTPINSQIGNLANQILAQNSTISSIGTSIGTINTTITGMQAAIDTLAQLQGDGTAIVTLISTETTQRISGDSAIAVLISKIGAADADGFSFLVNMSTAKIGPSETLAQRFGSITAGLSGNTAAINTETSARTSADTALAQTISKIGALTGSGAAFLLNVDTALVGPTESLAQRLSALGVSIGNATAAVTTETNARVAGDNSLASQITTLQSTVGGFSSAISTNATAINGVYASYSVKVDNNGRVAGFGLISQPNNGSIVSSFVFNSDAFSIFNGASAVAPFTVVGGVVRMQNVEILNANITNLNVDKLVTGTLNAQMNVGTGKIVWSNGTFMKVVGIGFGSASQFIEWFGPANVNFALCTEGNAITYLKTNGAAYFGGTLTAGALRVAYQTPALGLTTIESPDFQTNGNAKQVVCSFTYSHTNRKNAGTGSITGTGSATIVFERSINSGGAYTTIATLTAVESERLVIVDGDPAVKDLLRYQMGVSATVSDTTAANTTSRLRARVTARSVPILNGTGTANDVEAQSAGFISTEF